MRTLRLFLAAAACVLAPLALAHDTPAASTMTLHALVEAAWQRAPLASTLAARRHETGAARDVAASWLAAAPTLGVSDRSDRWTDGRGQRETELSLSAPLVLPVQHGARQQLADRADDELDAQLAQARLDVAGEVRTRLWEGLLARAVLAEQEDHVTHLEELAADVERRVKAGELARSDALLASQEVLAAVGTRAAARDRASAALARFRLLTGAPALPDVAPEPLPGAGPQMVPVTVHPRLLAAHAAQARAQASVAVASANRHAGPTLGVATRRERDGGAAGTDRSIGLSLQIPLSGQLRNRPAEALAGTQLATASAELAQAQAAVEIDLALARERLANARAALDAASERAAALREHTALFRQAYDLGDKPLADLLRSRALTHEAEVALRQQRIALAQAHSQLNQASGIVP